jgi:uncharacterized protein
MTELIKIGIVFVITLVLTFRRVALWISLLVASFLTGILFDMPFEKILIDFGRGALSIETLLLVGGLFTILWFSNLLKQTGRMDEILQGFRCIFRDVRFVIAILPAMIGLMPMMGGALVSAPMVVEGSDELKLSPERKTFINYWFRHVWEYVMPTYPAFIVACGLIGIPAVRFARLNFPLTIAAILSGICVGFWGVSRSSKPRHEMSGVTYRRLIKNLSPLVVSLVLVIAFKVELMIGFGLTILGMIFLYRIDKGVIRKSLIESISVNLLLAVMVIMGFKKVLESSQAVMGLSMYLSSSGIPAWMIAILIPLSIGVITGVTIGPMGIGFPILIPLFQDDPNFLNYMMLAFAGGVAGDLLSPFHLCLILTKDYFGADLKGVYRFVWFPVICILSVGVFITLWLRR